MGIVSIGEVVGVVQAEPSSEQEQPQAEEARAEEHAAPLAQRAEELERELRVRAWRQTRLQAD